MLGVRRRDRGKRGGIMSGLGREVGDKERGGGEAWFAQAVGVGRSGVVSHRS